MRPAGDPLPPSDVEPDPLRGVAGLGPTRAIDSPERVRLDLELAGPMSRAFAFSIDYGLVLIAMAIVLVVVVSGLQQIFDWASELTVVQNLVDSATRWLLDEEIEDSPRIMRAVALLVGVWLVLDLLFTTLYFVVCETLWAGRTPGKQLTGLRVVSEGGHVVGLRASLLRNLLRAVDTLPAGYLIGLVAMILSPRVQRVGDVVAGTVVVRERANDPASGVGWSPVDPQVEAGFRLTREEVAAIGEVERRLIRQTLRRADALSNREARPLLDRACGAIGARIGRPEPIPGPLQRDFLKALLGASERLL